MKFLGDATTVNKPYSSSLPGLLGLAIKDFPFPKAQRKMKIKKSTTAKPAKLLKKSPLSIPPSMGTRYKIKILLEGSNFL